eukprot:TRINITY_DN47397_c0_g1_i1.p1 TRINITY_DN47397_c0_g1~~TRINITY_DN47397_c0_g1_i1.p1  ORF type:complete len:854 (+),score=126.79 TRINITY_DN47397_c0_g1_i1:46-2562(+)
MTSNGRSPDEEEPLMSNRTGDSSDSDDGYIYQEVVKASTRKFRKDAELAIRAGVFVIICGLPFLVPKGTMDFLDSTMDSGVYSATCVINFVYTLYRSVGETVYNAVCSIKGTLLAAINIYIMFSIFPDGGSNWLTWLIGVSEGIAFILIMLWLAWDINTTVFAVSTWVFYWMAFLHPPGANFSRLLNFDISHTEISGLVSAAVGSILAIVATLVPYPLLALTRATEISQDLCERLPQAWEDFAKFFCASQPNIYRQDRIIEELKQLQELSQALEGHIANSWWECFGCGRMQVTRVSLTALDKFIARAFDTLCGARTACTALDWGPRHKDIMESVEPQISVCIAKSRSLMVLAVRAACDGDLDDAEEEDIRRLIKDVQQASSSLTKVFSDMKHHFRLPVISEDELLEHVFCAGICAFCSQVVGLGQDLLRIDALPPVRETPGGLGALLDRSVITDRTHLTFVSKGAIAVLVSFFIGYVGSPVLGLAPYEAGIACTASLLMSKALGSAIVKNLQRVQGVVLGTVCGQLIHRLFITCAWYNSLILAVILFIWVSFNIFIYYNSAVFATIGCLLAAFGATKILGGCEFNVDATETESHLLSGYSSIVTTVIAVSVIIAVDVAFCQERASDMTFRAITDAWQAITAAIENNFDSKVKETRYHKQEVLGKIMTAEALGQEAAMEPRFHRTAWPESTFSSTIQFAHNMRYNLTNMEYTIAHDNENGGMKTDAILQIEQIPTFGRLPEILVSKMRILETLLKVFIHENELPMAELEMPELTREYRSEERQARRAFIADAVKVKAFQGRSFDTLEDDPACQVCLMLCSIDAMLLHLRNLQHKMMQSH